MHLYTILWANALPAQLQNCLCLQLFCDIFFKEVSILTVKMHCWAPLKLHSQAILFYAPCTPPAHWSLEWMNPLISWLLQCCIFKIHINYSNIKVIVGSIKYYPALQLLIVFHLIYDKVPFFWFVPTYTTIQCDATTLIYGQSNHPYLSHMYHFWFQSRQALLGVPSLSFSTIFFLDAFCQHGWGQLNHHNWMMPSLLFLHQLH